LPKELSLMPGGPMNTDPLRDTVWAVARDMVSGGQNFQHIGALLRREAPRLLGRPIGAPIIKSVDREDPDRLLEASKRAVHALDRSWLVIQGPPGAGKTYTTSHLAVSLIQAGKTVGIASNRHKAGRREFSHSWLGRELAASGDISVRLAAAGTEAGSVSSSCGGNRRAEIIRLSKTGALSLFDQGDLREQPTQAAIHA
jgi:GAF domain-containing protein